MLLALDLILGIGIIFVIACAIMDPISAWNMFTYCMNKIFGAPKKFVRTVRTNHRKKIQREIDEAVEKLEAFRKNIPTEVVSVSNELTPVLYPQVFLPMPDDKPESELDLLIRVAIREAVKNFNASYMSKTENISIEYEDIEYRTVKLDLNRGGYCDGKRIYINSEWFDISTTVSDVISNVVFHEIAHLIDFWRRGHSCHDEYWQKLYECCGGKNGNYLDGHKNASTSYANKQGYGQSELDREDVDSADYEYTSDGKRMCFINIHTGHKVYHEDALFHTLKRRLLNNDVDPWDGREDH